MALSSDILKKWARCLQLSHTIHTFVICRDSTAYLNLFRTNLYGTPQILKASLLDVIIPGVFRIPIKLIVIDGQLRCIISLWVSWPAFAVYADTLENWFRIIRKFFLLVIVMWLYIWIHKPVQKKGFKQ